MTRENPPDELFGEVSESVYSTELEADAQSTFLPLPPVSGLYTWKQLLPIIREELRIDVDGSYPQNVASGTVHGGIASRVHWIANLTPSGPNTWNGSIWYKDGPVLSFPYTNVVIKVHRSLISSLQKATVVFSGGAPPRTRVFKYTSRYFRKVDFEFDFAEGEAALTEIDTGAHPNRPATLPVENLTMKKTFNRTGFDVTTSPGANVPISGAGVDAVWSNNEMHDAMQIYWSHFAASAQWAFWIFFASLHEWGTGLGGIMFDDIGPNQRQGTAIFNDSFISVPPGGDAAPAAWIKRMIYWTACHEMGHSFNLAHSWQKSLVFDGHGPWIPLLDEPLERSFMNYPFVVPGGESAFFSDFEFRFSDGELLFMRHAPERFVRMGDALWFDNHGFQEANVLPQPSLTLELRANRDKPIFEFLEPVVLELKLKNTSSEPRIVPENILATQEAMTVIIKKQGEPARQYAPYARYCHLPKGRVLNPGDKMYDSLFVAAGLGGWQIAEPGNYLIQLSVNIGGEDIVSNPLTLRVTPPRGYEEEVLAQDFFCNDVGRVLAFDGSRHLDKANDVLRQVSEQLSDRRVAIHTRVPLAKVKAREYKLLDVNTVRNGEQVLAVNKVAPADADTTYAELTTLLSRPGTAAETLGHIDFKYYVDFFTESLVEQGENAQAARLQDTLYDTLSARNVLKSVLEEIRSKRDSAARAAAK
ncbi:MAG TPA: hypothetical protein VKA70_08330 [Blastocatellia bacterium]|nr:hypothetical protein [Blastocatellia bacterium]